jgi:Na+/melibiose symporter-like transporter
MTTARVGLGRLFALSSFGFSIPLVHAVMEPGLLGAKVLELAPDDRNTALGGLTFAGLSVAVFAQPIVGALSDRTRSRFGPRLPWMAAGCVLCAIAGSLTVLAPAFWMLLLAYGLVQLGTNTIQGPWQAVVPDEVPREAHGRAAAIKSVLEMASAVAGRAATGEILAQEPTWGRGVLWIALGVAVFFLIVGLGISALAIRHRETSANSGAGESALALLRSSIGVLHQNPVFRLWFLNRVLFWGAFITVTTFLLFYVIDVLGLPEAEAQSFVGRISAVVGAVLVVAVLLVGWLSDRLGRRLFMIAAGGLASAGALVLIVARDPVGASVSAGLVALGCGLYMASSWALITETVPAAQAARSLGLANVATAGASALVRLPVGALIDGVNARSDEPSTGYIVAYGLAALAFVTSSVVAWRLPRR